MKRKSRYIKTLFIESKENKNVCVIQFKNYENIEEIKNKIKNMNYFEAIYFLDKGNYKVEFITLLDEYNSIELETKFKIEKD